MWKKLAKPVMIIGGVVGTVCALPLKRLLRKSRCRSTYNKEKSKQVSLKVCNECPYMIDLYWVNYEGELQPFDSVKPGRVYSISSWNTHAWCFKPADGAAKPAWRYRGASAALRVLPSGALQVQPLAKKAAKQPDDCNWMKPEWGQYRERGRVAGMPVMAYDCVGDDAVAALSCCITHMTACMRPDIMERLQKARCRLAIIGRNQTTTDIPEHHFMCQQVEEGGRDVDATARGLGATPAVPTCSCGEENLTMLDDDRYYEESILVHEFAHAVMNLGFSEKDKRTVRRLFKQAQQQELYNPDCYMMENADEYWAEGAQAWFDAIVRTDVNSGVCTRQLLQRRDPGLAELLLQVYGDNSWRYTDTCPGVLRTAKEIKDYRKKQREQQQQRQRTLSNKSEQQQQQQSVAAAHPAPEAAEAGMQLPRSMLRGRPGASAGTDEPAASH